MAASGVAAGAGVAVASGMAGVGAVASVVAEAGGLASCASAPVERINAADVNRKAIFTSDLLDMIRFGTTRKVSRFWRSPVGRLKRLIR